jgi:RNA polymerase sigma-70 factor (sigma-E family)
MRLTVCGDDRGGSVTVDDSQFRDFVHGSQKRLVNFAEFLVGDRGRAEDLVQDAYVKTYARWPSVQDRSPEAYVRACIINGRTDWWRRRASTEKIVDSRSLAGLASGADAIAEVDQRLVVLAALGRLSRRERTVIVLRYYLGLSEGQIATELGLAPGTVKSTASRAVGKLRDDPLIGEGAVHDIR